MFVFAMQRHIAVPNYDSHFRFLVRQAHANAPLLASFRAYLRQSWKQPRTLANPVFATCAISAASLVTPLKGSVAAIVPLIMPPPAAYARGSCLMPYPRSSWSRH